MSLRPEAQPQPRGRPRDPRTDGAIRRATLELVAEKGYDRTSIEGVAALAGVSKTTIYRRFPSKSRLVAWALEGMDVAAMGDVDTGDLRNDLIAVAQFAVRLMEDELLGAVVVSLVAEARHHPDLHSDLFLYHSLVEPSAVARVLWRAQERGDLPPDAPVAVADEVLLKTVYATYLVIGERLSQERLEAVVDLVLAGLGYSRPARTAGEGGA
jgi:AcrR family transcriptional regulator